jgi:serine/threonine-protein kinase RsbW
VGAEARNEGQYKEMHVERITAPVSLALPADPTSISIVRAVVASVASRLALTYEAVDDLRIAVAEAATMLLTRDERADRLHVELFPGEDDLRLMVWVEGAAGVELQASPGDSLAWRVIEGLADEAAETDVDGCPAVELRMRTVPA